MMRRNKIQSSPNSNIPIGILDAQQELPSLSEINHEKFKSSKIQVKHILRANHDLQKLKNQYSSPYPDNRAATISPY